MNQGNVAELRQRFDREYLPIRLGNWSKVNCEFRHRFCQVTDEFNKNSCNPDIGCRYIDDDQTLPKLNPNEENISGVIHKLDEYFRSKKRPIHSNSTEQDDHGSVDGTSPAQSPDSAIYMNVTSPLDFSDSLVDLNEQEESKCSLNATKVYVEFKSRKFHCEGCGESFSTMDGAESHLFKDLKINHHQAVVIEETITERYVVENDKMQMSGYNFSEGTGEEDNVNLNSGEGNPVEDNTGDETDGVFNSDEKEFTYDEYATLQKKNLDDIDKDSRGNSNSDLLKFIIEDEEKSTMKKKKSKTWKFIRGTFMLIIRILF